MDKIPSDADDHHDAAPQETFEAVDWSAGRAKLFAERVKVFPKRVKGRFRSIKWAFFGILLTIYYLTPWIRWDRGPYAPDQAVLIDLPARRFYFFGIEIWPQEVYYLTGILLLAALGLFFITSLFGRLWCAWACPQTVWTDLYMWVERKIEGDRNARIRLDRAPWTLEKLAKRALKHLIWIVIAMATGGAWVFYFADAPTLAHGLLTGTAPSAAYITIGLLTFTTYLLAGHAREQVCTYMCPYSRFQSVMLDEESVIVTYRSDRGEPRGPHKKGTSWEGRGDCIDCTLCISVCPTGIDIRNGPQIECLNCGLCADACDSVMDRVGLPRGLIGLDSLANVERRARGEPERARLARPRTLAYGALLAIIAVAMGVGLATRSDMGMNLLQDRNPVYVLLSDGSIRNGFTVKVLNKLRNYRDFRLTVEGLEGARMSVVGAPVDAQGALLRAGPDRVDHFRLFIRAPRRSLKGHATPFRLVLGDPGRNERIVYEAVFHGPE